MSDLREKANAAVARANEVAETVTDKGALYRVLVVDDEDDIRETLADVLKAEGYLVETAHNGAEALRRMGECAPDLVLVDLMMPIMNGWDFHAQVRHDPKFARMPVVAVSAMPDRDISRRFSGYLRKPFELEALLEVVQQFQHAA